MSELHVRQIRAALEKHFQKHIDLTDVSSRPPQQQTDAFLTRSQIGFVISHLTGVKPEVAGAAVTDEFGDNGVDAVYHHASERILYVGQSKWRHDGSGSVDRGDAQKFLKGFKDLVNARWHRFGDKIKQRATDLELVLNDASTRIVLVLCYTGQAPLPNLIQSDLQDVLDEINSPTELVSVQVFRQANIYSAVAQGLQVAAIDVEVALYEWGMVKEPYPAFYGQVSASDLANWYSEHQGHLFAPNIRMFLGNTEVNHGVVDTILSSPSDFWYFNNGVSALCRTIKKKPIGGSTRETGLFDCHDLHIVNGAQTVGAIAAAASKDPSSVAQARVPIRLISLENCPAEYDKKITKYNNTQNRIDRRDFVALDIEQERVRGELLLEGIAYVFKSGETLTPSDKGFGLEEATVARACC